MTLFDNETGKDIINPYITLYNPGKNKWVAINASTFGEEGQSQLISIYDERTQSQLVMDEDKKLYKVVATVGKQNAMLNYEGRNIFPRNIRVAGASDPVALIPLGYLLEDVVKELFPKSYSFFIDSYVVHWKEKEIRGEFEETSSFQKRYESLLEICDHEGSIIRQDRVLERDKDIFPHNFYRKGTREYVFPKQKVESIEDDSKVIDPNIDYTLTRQKEYFKFDESLVKGRITIEYKDSDNKPCLKVVVTENEIPKEVYEVLEKVLEKK